MIAMGWRCGFVVFCLCFKYVCIKYVPFYTAFIRKEHFVIFGELVQKTLKMTECHLLLVKYVNCMLTDFSGKCNKIVMGSVVCTYLYGICVLCKSPVLYRVMPQ